MEIKHTLKEARSLTDPICPLGAAAEQWGCGHGESGELGVPVSAGRCWWDPRGAEGHQLLTLWGFSFQTR